MDIRNGGEDDEVATLAAAADEEVRGKAGGAAAGGLRSGAGGLRWSRSRLAGAREVDRRDSLEGTEDDGPQLAPATGHQEELHQRGRRPKRRRRLGRGVS